MMWQPYTYELLVSPADVCVRDQHVWRTTAPLICFDIVEWHRPDRVLRQFGLQQRIPVQCDSEVKIHAIDRRGRHYYNWKAYHQQYIKLWAVEEKSIVTIEPKDSTMHYHDPYMKWYRSITHRLITPFTQKPHKRIQPASGMSHLLKVHSLTNIHNQCTTTLGTFTSDSAMQSLIDIQIMCTHVLQMIGEIRHLETITAPTTTMAPPSPLQAKGQGKGLGIQQKAMEQVITSQHSSPQVVVAIAHSSITEL
ncbi:hypothetical protein Pint_14543 [Pistacia integerrima]|uniref:Uncharacterized protein n=1 Tax=Pistacia integerrima TaxID=434235 RepID=A0ACC0Y884_9ROSI|nr:hypothetical protein Pint_14543 [Pistacia integerrima]